MSEHPIRDVLKMIGNVMLKFAQEVSERKRKEFRLRTMPGTFSHLTST